MLLKNSILCDYKGQKIADIRLDDGKISNIASSISPYPNEEVIDCEGKIILPSMIDIAYPKNKTLSLKMLSTLAKKSLIGGVGSIILRADTNPRIDSEAIVEFVRSINTSLDINLIPSILPIQEQTLNPISSLISSGAYAIATNGDISGFMLHKITQYAKMLDIPIIATPIDSSLSDGVMNEGELCSTLGLNPILSIGQTLQVARLAEMARFTRTKWLFDSITQPQSFEIIAMFKQMGADISIQTPIHHLILSDKQCDGYDTRAKIFPPLLSEDAKAYLLTLLNSNIDMLSALQSDSYNSLKDQVFDMASFGIDAIEYYFALGYEYLIKPNIISLSRFSYLTSFAQAKILGLNKGALEVGLDADIIIIDPNQTTTINDLYSPYNNLTLQSKVTQTIINAKTHFKT